MWSGMKNEAKEGGSFLTSVPLRDVDEYELDSSNADELEPLEPFHAPPMPRIAGIHHYFSLSRNQMCSTSALPEWERNLIFSRLRRAEPLDVQAFQERLSSVKERNKRENICRLRANAVREAATVAAEREELFLEEERRREGIFYRYKHLKELRKQERFLLRAELWYTIIVSHVFLTALMKQRKVQEALEKLRFLLSPMAKRFLALRHLRAAAAELTKQHLRDIPFPFPNVIEAMSGTFFKGWPAHLLEKLVQDAKPCYLKKGSYLMHDGDVGRVMFMITLGSVSIILRKKGPDKRRTKENSSGVFQINAPCYVGEFALVCKEPRSASIYCETDIGYWAVLPESYEEVAKFLTADVANKQREATDVRRRQNLKRFFPLRVEFLYKFAYFEKFSSENLTRIIDSVEPIVLHDKDFLFQEGEMDSSVYFFQDGIAIMRDSFGMERNIVPGSCIGMFECSCGVNEPKPMGIISSNYCDVWRLRRDTLIDVGMGEPAALLHCRIAAKHDRALQMKKETSTPAFLKADPYLSFCLSSSLISRLYAAGTPTVFLNGERLAMMGQSRESLVVLLNGMVDVTMVKSGEQLTFRITATRQGRGTQETAQGDMSAFRGFTRVIGAYEFAASMSQFVCTVTSFSLTEAIIIDNQKIDSIIPPSLRQIMHTNLRARDIVREVYKQQNAANLSMYTSMSFVQQYKILKEAEREQHKV